MPDSKVARAPDDAFELDKGIAGESNAKKSNNNIHPYPTGIKLAIIIASLAASVFLVALDETIIATAIPRITDEFHSLTDVGWYGSAYLLTLCAFQLPYGKIFTFFSDKAVFLCALLIFEVGSVVCATAQSSTVFIVGRAVAGLGSAGINAGYIIIIAASLPLERRPIFVSSYSISSGLATAIAPVIGGAFTTHLTWRWCFWINLPLGLLTALVVVFFYHARPASSTTHGSPRKKWQQLDFVGTTLVISGTTCLLLALQWGGSKYAWDAWRIILLFVFAAVLTVAFVAVQVRKQETATLPPRIVKNRSVASSALFVFAAGSAVNVMEYFLPMYFQAIKGATALRSGILTLPMVTGKVVFSLVAGYGVAKLGYYTPFMLVGATLLSVATGLISTWRVSTSEAFWIGSQLLLGTGSGLGIQQAHTAAQTVLADADVPTGAVIIIFAQIFGGAIFISVAESVFANQLRINIQQVTPWLDAHTIIKTGATNIRKIVAVQDLDSVVRAYSDALDSAYYVAVGLAAVSIIGALGTEWKSIKKRGNPEKSKG